MECGVVAMREQRNGLIRRFGSLALATGVVLSGVVTLSATSASAALTLTPAAPSVVYPVSGGDITLPAAQLGHHYAVQLVSPNGLPADFVVAINYLPLGLTLSSSGLISGTPLLPESESFALNVEEVGPPPEAWTGPTLDLTVSSGYPTLDPTLIPAGTTAHGLANGSLELGDPIQSLLTLVDATHIAPLIMLVETVYTLVFMQPPPPPQD
jgi:hypothetical protein